MSKYPRSNKTGRSFEVLYDFWLCQEPDMCQDVSDHSSESVCFKGVFGDLASS